MSHLEERGHEVGEELGLQREECDEFNGPAQVERRVLNEPST